MLGQLFTLHLRQIYAQNRALQNFFLAMHFFPYRRAERAHTFYVRFGLNIFRNDARSPITPR